MNGKGPHPIPMLCPNCGAALKVSPITISEIEVLRLLWAGNTVAQIAEKRFVSVKTIEAHRNNLKAKAGADSMAALFRWGLKEGILKIEK